MLEDFLLRLEPLLVLDEVHVSEHAHHLRHPVHLADVDELEGLHLEAEGRVDEEQDLEEKKLLGEIKFRLGNFELCSRAAHLAQVGGSSQIQQLNRG